MVGWERVEAGARFRLMAVLEANQENLVVVDVADVDKRPLATHVPPSLPSPFGGIPLVFLFLRQAGNHQRTSSLPPSLSLRSAPFLQDV